LTARRRRGYEPAVHSRIAAAAPAATSPPSAAPRPRRGTILAEGVAVFLLYAGMTCWWLWPLPNVWSDHSALFNRDYAPSVADGYLITWALAWDTHALLTNPLHLFDANIFHPSKLALAYSEHFLGYVPIFGPIYMISGNALLAMNLTTFLTYPLCALAMYALARRFVGRPAALCAGAFFAFYPTRYLSMPHVHQLGVQYMPLAILFAERWFERARVRDAALLAVAIALQSLCSFYLAYALMLGFAAYALLALWHWRRRLDARRVLGLGLSCVAGFVPMGLAGIPYLKLRELGLIPSYDAQSPAWRAMGLIPYFAWKKVHDYLTETGIGWFGYGLGAIAVLMPKRGRRWPLVLGAVLTLFGLLISYGPTLLLFNREIWSPYELFARWIPGLSAVRLPGRFLVVAQLGLALLAALGAQRLIEVLPRRAAFPGAAAIVAVYLWTMLPLPPLPIGAEKTWETLPPVYRWLANHGEGKPLLEVPGSSDFAHAGERMYFSTFHWLPIVEGYSGYPPMISTYLHSLGNHLPSEPHFQRLVDSIDLGWVVVHLDQLDDRLREGWKGPFPSGLDPVARWGDDLLFAVTRPMRVDRRSRLMSTVTTPNGIPLAPLGPDCSGRIELVSGLEEPIPVTEKSHGVVLELWNRSAAPWPGFGFYPAHLVKGEVTLLRKGEPVRVPENFDLYTDVPPGERIRVAAGFTVEVPPGDYEILVRLVQPQDGSLERCGVPALRLPVRVG
jgi:hypothetical protein